MGPKTIQSTMPVGSQLCDGLIVCPFTQELLFGGLQIKLHQFCWALTQSLCLTPDLDLIILFRLTEVIPLKNRVGQHFIALLL